MNNSKKSYSFLLTKRRVLGLAAALALVFVIHTPTSAQDKTGAQDKTSEIDKIFSSATSVTPGCTARPYTVPG